MLGGGLVIDGDPIAGTRSDELVHHADCRSETRSRMNVFQRALSPISCCYLDETNWQDLLVVQLREDRCLLKKQAISW